jgi:tetratricopeptide (TPR) repeat protein
MDVARTLPLNDGWRRFESLRVLRERRLAAPLAREVAIVLRGGRETLYPVDVAERSSAEHALRAGDWLTAASLHERTLLNFTSGLEFSEPAAYLRLPHTIHRERARGLLEKGDLAGAEREIAAARAVMPGDVMLPIEVVPAFERLGNKARADELYAEAMNAQLAKLAKYPNSSNHHNNAAWLAVTCGRDRDAALTHAKRATELRPDNAAVTDTLAEVLLKRGDFDGAIAAIKKCIALEPKTPRHREQLERIQAAKRGETRPMPPE